MAGKGINVTVTNRDLGFGDVKNWLSGSGIRFSETPEKLTIDVGCGDTKGELSLTLEKYVRKGSEMVHNEDLWKWNGSHENRTAAGGIELGNKDLVTELQRSYNFLLTGYKGQDRKQEAKH